LEEALGVLYRCPRCLHEFSRPFTGPGGESYAPNLPLGSPEEEEKHGH
jgi:hypothetical protein